MDRSKQRRILEHLAGIYPMIADYQSLVNICGEDGFERNLHYLIEHELVRCSVKKMTSTEFAYGSPKITAAGLDFLEDDGGLSAILNTVTVKLHDDTIRQLLIDRVEASDESPTVRAELVAAIRKAPAEALSQVSAQAVQVGIQNLPGVVGMLRTMLGL